MDIVIIKDRGSLKQGQEINNVNHEAAMSLIGSGHAKLKDSLEPEEKTKVRKSRKKKDE